MEEYVRLYGEKVWTYSTFVTNSALISNYIIPLIGHKEMKDITPKEVDRLITALQKTAPVEAGGRKRKTEYLPAISIEKIIKLLRSAFKQAVRWEIIPRNPFDSAQLPKVERKSREIWTADTIRTVLDHCKDDRLYIAINLAFACSLRLGEILGLTWDNVHIEDSDIDRDAASVLRAVFPSPTPPTLILSEIILPERIIILSSLLYLLSKCIIKHQEFNDIQAAIST